MIFTASGLLKFFWQKFSYVENGQLNRFVQLNIMKAPEDVPVWQLVADSNAFIKRIPLHVSIEGDTTQILNFVDKFHNYHPFFFCY